MNDLPDISQEIKTLELLKKKLDYLNSLDISYDSKDIKQHCQNIKKTEQFLFLLSEIKKSHDNCINLLDLQNNSELWEMAKEEYEENLEKLTNRISDLYKNIASADEENANEIILEIRAGTGGDEASLFAMDLLKMYNKYSENKKWKFEIIDISQNELRGIKSCSISITGEGVFKYLQFESGVHRVQRIPETEANGRIHTSTVTVSVLPCEEEVDIELDMKDIRKDTYRAGGAGGQHVNKTDSAVRLTHVPTGIVVQCQDERSQIKNNDKAMKILKIKIAELKKGETQNERNQARDQQIGTGDRSEKSRTYNYPENRITDHRYNVKLYQLDFIIAGDLDLLVLKIYDEHQKIQLAAKAKTNLIDSLQLS